jgi:ubiquinone/menaquinone biosynthesis C-methylase UbiE
MSLVPPQVNREELLDMQRGTLSQVRTSLHDIRRINNYLGGASVVLNATMQMLQERNIKSATVLDIGTGCADVPVRLVRLARAEASTASTRTG